MLTEAEFAKLRNKRLFINFGYTTDQKWNTTHFIDCSNQILTDQDIIKYLSETKCSHVLFQEYLGNNKIEDNLLLINLNFYTRTPETVHTKPVLSDTINIIEENPSIIIENPSINIIEENPCPAMEY